VTDTEAQQVAPQPAHDRDQMNVGRIAVVVVILAVGMALAIGLCWLVMGEPQRADRTIFPAAMASLRGWRCVVIHHTGTPGGDLQAAMRVHAVAGSGSAATCHFVIGNGQGMDDGEIAATPLWIAQQAVEAPGGVGEADGAIPPGAVHVVLVGDFENGPLTLDQMNSLVRLTHALANHCRIPLARVFVHSDLEAVACPGSAFPTSELLRRLGDKLRS